MFKNVSFEDLRRGDVIQISTNMAGNISVFRPLFVQKYAPEDYAQLVSYGGSGYVEFPNFETFYGQISRRSPQLITMKAGNIECSFVCNQPQVYRYDSSLDTLELLAVNDLAAWLAKGRYICACFSEGVPDNSNLRLTHRKMGGLESLLYCTR